MRVLVLGMNGMLGRCVYNYFFTRYDVVGTTRKELNASTAGKNILVTNIRPGDVVINCIGLIKQRSEARRVDFVAVNSMFPLLLQEACSEKGAKLIHITTDCVFAGLKGPYDESSVHDATDIYGRSKSLGEPEDATVIRTSIIGEELTGKLSLLEWVKSNAGKEAKGYTDHFWNGITCLQFAEVCELIIKNDLFWKGIKHIFSPEIFNKCELVKLISKVYDLNVTVIPYETGVVCDRSLASIREDVSMVLPGLEAQLVAMRNFFKGGN